LGLTTFDPMTFVQATFFHITFVPRSYFRTHFALKFVEITITVVGSIVSKVLK
jgi:hypothetical protein